MVGLKNTRVLPANAWSKMSGICFGAMLPYVSRYVPTICRRCMGLDDKGVVVVCFRVCIAVCIGGSGMRPYMNS